MNTLLRIGLIGCGRAAERLYLPALLRLTEEAKLVGVVDPLDERRKLISKNVPGCLAFSSAEELLRKGNVEAAIIATPPDTHVRIAKLALQAGIPVLVEKPLSSSLAEAEELEVLSTSSNSLVMVGFNQRNWEPICRIRGVLNSQHNSDKITAQVTLTSDVKTWSPISALSVSDLLDDLGSHQFDLLRYIFDRELTAVSAHWINPHTIQMRVRLGGDVIADCLLAQSKITQEYINIQCGGQQYIIRLGSERMSPATGPIRSVLDLSDTFRRRISRRLSSFRSSHERQLINFLNFIRNNIVPNPGIADGIAAIRSVEAARRSAAEGGMEVLI